MEFFIDDPNIVRLPPAETHLLDLRALPDPTGKRLRIFLDLTPFQQKPVIEINLTDSAGTIVSSATIIEPIGWKLELTMHVRNPAPAHGKYSLTTVLTYPELGDIDRRTIFVDLSTPAE